MDSPSPASNAAAPVLDRPSARVGRPAKWSADRALAILASLREGLHYEPACHLAGCSYRVFRDWVLASEADDPAFVITVPGEDGAPVLLQFAQAVKRAESEYERSLVKTVTAGTERQPDLALKMLGRRHPQRWAEQTHVDVTHSGTVTQVHTLALPAPGAFTHLAGLLDLPSVDGAYAVLPDGDPTAQP